MSLSYRNTTQLALSIFRHAFLMFGKINIEESTPVSLSQSSSLCDSSTFHVIRRRERFCTHNTRTTDSNGILRLADEVSREIVQTINSTN